MSHPKVSVVVPAFNPGAYLAEAVGSVVNQTFADWELVVIDDESDEDLSWVREVDPRVRLIRIEHLGTSGARNQGIASTTGPFVAFLDQDDRWRPRKLERQLELVVSTGAALSHTAFDLMDEDGKSLGPGYGRAVNYRDMLAGELGILNSSVVVRRTALEAVGGCSTVLQMQQDLDLFLRLSQVGTTSFVDSVEVDYRTHSRNASRNYWLAARELLITYEQHRLLAETNHDSAAVRAINCGERAVRRTYSFQAIDAAREAQRSDRPVAAATALHRAVRLSPRASLESLAALVRSRLARLYALDRGESSP